MDDKHDEHNLLAQVDSTRKWLMLASLCSTGALLLFFICAPYFGYPLEHPQNMRLLYLTIPVFSGYLGSMTAFVFGGNKRRLNRTSPGFPFLGMMVKGPIVLFSVTVLGSLLAFGYANRQSAPPGSGMSADALFSGVAFCLGILTATTSSAVAYLFQSESSRPRTAPRSVRTTSQGTSE